MKLKVTTLKKDDTIPLFNASLLRDDVNGGSLVIESGSRAIQIKLSDLMAFLAEQESQSV
jgi:hypothetical protein